PEAIGPRAEMRTALDHLAGNRELRLSRIVAALTVAATRVLRHAARRDIAAGRGAVPIRRPFPHIPGHVEEPVAVGRKGPDRGRSGPAVGLQVLPGERALPRVRAWLGFLEIALA